MTVATIDTPRTPTRPEADPTWQGSIHLERSPREILGDLAVIATAPVVALTAWVATGEPVGMVTGGALGAVVAVLVEHHARRQA